MGSAARALYPIPWIFLAPAVIVFAIYVVIPVFQSFWLSLYDWDGLSPTKKFVGLSNYAALFQDDQFWTSLKNNVYWLVLFFAWAGDRVGNCYLSESEDPRDADREVHLLFPLRAVWGGYRVGFFVVLRARPWPLERYPGEVRTPIDFAALGSATGNPCDHRRRALAADRLLHDPLSDRSYGSRS